MIGIVCVCVCVFGEMVASLLIEPYEGQELAWEFSAFCVDINSVTVILRLVLMVSRKAVPWTVRVGVVQWSLARV